MKNRGPYSCGMSLLMVVLFFVFQTGCTPSQAVDNSGTSNEEIVQAIANDNWIFTADQALPQRGQRRILTSPYDVICSKDTLVVYLPYFGRAYTAPIGQTSGPLEFTSTKFTIDKEKDDKGRWNVTIKPTDNSEVRSLYFTFYDNGTAQLQALFSNRDGIGFSGKLEKKK